MYFLLPLFLDNLWIFTWIFFRQVIEACKTYVPSLGCGFSNPKLTLYTGDGAEFLEKTDEKFDVIITDASDPVVADDDQGDKTKDGMQRRPRTYTHVHSPVGSKLFTLAAPFTNLI